MAIHFLHIRKSGGTAVKHALRQVKKASANGLMSPFGEVLPHPHSFRLRDVPDDEQAIFSVRDPASRFVSGFYSRLRKGAPRYNREWSDEERKAFGWFSTPQELAEALTKGRGPIRKKAEFAMKSIRHINRPMVWWTGDADELRKRLPQVLYIARQETLDDDFERLKQLLQLPSDLALPSDSIEAHRFTGNSDRSLTANMMEALRDWYAADYRLIEVCEEVRREAIARVEDLASPSDAPRL